MNFATIEEGIVTNIIIAESKAIAEEITGLNCIEYTNNNPAGVGYTWDGVGFAAPKPYDSWTLDSSTYLWNAPTPMPVEEGKLFIWDELTLSWKEATND
jgi:hypothetical protein